MSSEKIEAFWQDATADDVARVMAGETVEARFRDEETEPWTSVRALRGWSDGKWLSVLCWNQCQVYREPSWYADKPDPGPGYRLLGKFPDEPKLGTDEALQYDGTTWNRVRTGSGVQDPGVWYRRRIEQLLSGHRWLVSGDRLESGDLYYEKGALLEVGHEYWGNHVMLAEAFMRKIEQPKPEPKHYVLRVGDSVETPRGHLINVVSSHAEQRIYSLDADDKLTLPNGQTITITEKGFEVTQ
jgi:hypothetical protein